jgi:predicted nucleic acid-binding protein
MPVTQQEHDRLADGRRASSTFAESGPPPRSVVTRAELLSGRGSEERRVQRLLEPMTNLSLDTAIAERAGRLRRGTVRRLPDALIAATALEHRLTLVTRNVRDFDGIRELKLRAPD